MENCRILRPRAKPPGSCSQHAAQAGMLSDKSAHGSDGLLPTSDNGIPSTPTEPIFLQAKTRLTPTNITTKRQLSTNYSSLPFATDTADKQESNLSLLYQSGIHGLSDYDKTIAGLRLRNDLHHLRVRSADPKQNQLAEYMIVLEPSISARRRPVRSPPWSKSDMRTFYAEELKHLKFLRDGAPISGYTGMCKPPNTKTEVSNKDGVRESSETPIPRNAGAGKTSTLINGETVTSPSDPTIIRASLDVNATGKQPGFAISAPLESLDSPLNPILWRESAAITNHDKTLGPEGPFGNDFEKEEANYRKEALRDILEYNKHLARQKEVAERRRKEDVRLLCAEWKSHLIPPLKEKSSTQETVLQIQTEEAQEVQQLQRNQEERRRKAKEEYCRMIEKKIQEKLRKESDKLQEKYDMQAMEERKKQLDQVAPWRINQKLLTESWDHDVQRRKELKARRRRNEEENDGEYGERIMPYERDLQAEKLSKKIHALEFAEQLKKQVEQKKMLSAARNELERRLSRLSSPSPLPQHRKNITIADVLSPSGEVVLST